MRTLNLTNYSINLPRRVVLKSVGDFDLLESGDLINVKGGLAGRNRWLVYEGLIDGEYSFIEQDSVRPSQVISYRLERKSCLVTDNKLYIPRDLKNIKFYEPRDKGSGHRMGLLMAAGLWKSPARMVGVA